jgi:hypothetical protein
MKTLSTTIKVLTCAIFIMAISSAAQAQATRTWVSGVGDDVNPCSRTAPCKTFAGAISKTAAGGEISVLDPGGYGTVTITKSMTIDGQGTLASILNSGGINGVVINDALAAAPGTTNVTLRNISIHGAGATPGLNGIRFLRGRTLIVKNVVISGFSSNGIDAPISTAVATDRTRMFLTDVDISNGTGLTSAGVNASAPNAYFSVAMDRVHTQRVPVGARIGNNTFPTIRNSMFTNGTTGLEMVNGASGAPVAYLENTDLSENTTGLSAGSGTTTVLSQSSITVCSTGISGTGAVRSSGNNRILANSADGVAPVITLPK